jgi:hypothetical protein
MRAKGCGYRGSQGRHSEGLQELLGFGLTTLGVWAGAVGWNDELERGGSHLIVPEEEPKVIALPKGLDEMVTDMIITAFRMEDELDLLRPVAASRFPDLAPGREYWVRWRHQRRRQRIFVEQVFADPKLPMLRFRLPKRGRRGPAHYFRFCDLADFEPVVSRIGRKV